ncbi:ligand-binding sensor domain-containing protein [Streptococcus salivarius]|uniref:hypothetical protein n=1 Tax=Streptococcus salivarius TaxID=1304 RepID=UPI0011A3C7E1|nr:hypothetical protein [Streptococcus salivarius]MDU2934244.1 hypothetical protein [Streptococcus salivarius]
MSEIAKFLIKNNFINETYTDYLVRQSKNGLSRTEKDFLRSVLLKDSKELKKIKGLNQDNIYELFLRLSDHHFSVDNFFNEEIYDYFNKAFDDNNNHNKINIQGIEDYFKKIIFFQDTNDSKKIKLNLNSISRILYNKLVKPQEDNLFTKIENYISNKQISNREENETNLLLIILDQNILKNSEFYYDCGIDALLTRIYNISKKTDKQLLEDKLLDLIREKNYIITRLCRNYYFNNLTANRKEFYRTLWEKDKIEFNIFTFLPILSILENKQLDSYENIYDKLTTENAKNCIIDNLDQVKDIFYFGIFDFENISKNIYLTSNVSSFKSIIGACKKQDDKTIPFNLFNPIILWEELTNVQSEISREHYKEILDILDENFITEQLNKPSMSLITFKNLLENYKVTFLNKINIKSLESDEMKSLVPVPKKRPKRKSDNRNAKKNALIKYINQYSKIDDIDKNVINKYRVSDLLSIKDSIDNKELYREILKNRKRSVKNGKNSKNAIDKLIAEIETENDLPSTM